MSGNPEGHESQRLSRRQALAYGAGALGAVSFGGVLAGCGGGGAASSGATTAQETPAATSTAVAPQPKPGGTIKIAIGNFFQTDSLDPGINVSLLGLVVSGMLNETLVLLDEDWNATPMLAESWDVAPDLTKYTFKLRSGVTFHSGKTLEAADVVWSLQRVLDPKTGSQGLSIFAPVIDPAGITAADPTTVTFQLKVPDAFFLVRLGYFWGRISEANADFTKGSAGTGPFVSKSFTPGQGFEFVRNPNYWQSGLPYLDGINGIALAEPGTKVESVISGDVDISDSPDFPSIPRFEGSDSVELLKGLFGLMPTYSINAANSPFTDPDVRRACKMLLDRDKYVEVVARGAATASADSCIHPKDPFYPADLAPLPFDPEQAKSLLAKAGYSDGFKVDIWATPALPGSVDSAVLLKDAWAAGGIDLSVQSLDINEWVKHEATETIVTDVWLRAHPATAFPFFYTSDATWAPTRLNDSEIDQWVREAQATGDAALQKELYGKVLLKYNETSSTIWPGDYFDLWPHKKRVQGLTQFPTDVIDFRKVYVV